MPTNKSFSASTKAKENISNFNKLAASVVAANPSRGAPGRVPFGALNQNNMNINSPPTSVLSKKPSGHSHGAKAVKVLGGLKTVNNGVNASYNFDASFVSTGAADRSKDSTNVKDRVKDWERERERLREMGRLEDMENTYKAQKKEKKRQKEREKDAAVKERAEEQRVQNVENVAKENVADTGDLDRREQEVPEERPRIIDRKSASHLHIQVPASSTEPIDENANAEPRQEAWKTNHPDSGNSENIFSSATSPVLPMFSTGPRLTQGEHLAFCMTMLFLTSSLILQCLTSQWVRQRPHR